MRSVRRDKMELVDRLATDTEEAAEKNNVKAVCHVAITHQLSGRKTNTYRPVRGKYGRLLTKRLDRPTLKMGKGASYHRSSSCP